MTTYKQFHLDICDYVLDLYNDFRDDELVAHELNVCAKRLFSLSELEDNANLGAETMNSLMEAHSCFCDHSERSEVYDAMTDVIFVNYQIESERLKTLLENDNDRDNDRSRIKQILSDLHDEFGIASSTDSCCPSCGFYDLMEEHGPETPCVWSVDDTAEFDLYGNLVGNCYFYFYLPKQLMRKVAESFRSNGFKVTFDREAKALSLTKSPALSH